jgi:hypothetical protein
VKRLAEAASRLLAERFALVPWDAGVTRFRASPIQHDWDRHHSAVNMSLKRMPAGITGNFSCGWKPESINQLQFIIFEPPAPGLLLPVGPP